MLEYIHFFHTYWVFLTYWVKSNEEEKEVGGRVKEEKGMKKEERGKEEEEEEEMEVAPRHFAQFFGGKVNACYAWGRASLIPI